MEFQNKTVIISGGAEGIGFALAKSLGQAGMNVVIGDINAEALSGAEQTLKSLSIPVLAVTMDVANPDHWRIAIEHTIEKFGQVHAVVNNAGVGGKPGPVENNTLSDWQWCIDVNLIGVVNGMQAAVPEIKRAGGGWIINVGSMAGLIGVPFGGEYTATKLAVVGLSEAWSVELAPFGIHVAALCPAFVSTKIHLSERNRSLTQGQESASTPASLPDSTNPMTQLVTNGIDPDLLGERVIEALIAKETFILTHPNYRAAIQRRFKTIDAAFERAEHSPLVGHLKDAPVDQFIPQQSKDKRYDSAKYL